VLMHNEVFNEAKVRARQKGLGILDTSVLGSRVRQIHPAPHSIYTCPTHDCTQLPLLLPASAKASGTAFPISRKCNHLAHPCHHPDCCLINPITQPSDLLLQRGPVPGLTRMGLGRLLAGRGPPALPGGAAAAAPSHGGAGTGDGREGLQSRRLQALSR
jgi:hypothetical protein